jgi:hypothetical protein
VAELAGDAATTAALIRELETVLGRELARPVAEGAPLDRASASIPVTVALSEPSPSIAFAMSQREEPRRSFIETTRRRPGGSREIARRGARGHDVVSVHDPGQGLVAGALDINVLAAAQREARALVT